ncbi:MerR family transcriptional regulator [Amycolatopsis cihanbeyliensis]|uniref:MerR-like DNA binding protein n=1 Tax=Amycolatopsis cihanbeyliensis TaxID=1128664 RepID=A0A542DGW1_AMYCI|nr:MerR family transcriptional regulator [Amycolatopsis cihanbeyliensis]TQJ02294.1 MerR-like DNA binding protein [Amycolatopsis cihanbeyliensis]
MRMAELSKESGVPVATIKYYLREGLVPAGERTGRNQARYDETHVRRLRLVRALLDIGGFSIADVRAVLEAIDQQKSMHSVLGRAHQRLAPARTEADEDSRAWAMGRIEAVAEEQGWQLKSCDGAVDSLVSVLCTFRELGHHSSVELLSEYGAAAQRVAEADLGSLTGTDPAESTVERAVVGTALGDVLLAGLRRIAQQNASARYFGD